MEGKVFYKQVALIQGRYFSVFNAGVEYEIGRLKQEKPKPFHQGGFFVYPSAELAAAAEIKNGLGTNWIFPRVLLEVRCWGEMIQYPRFKLCFEYLLPIKDLGFPDKYLKNWPKTIEKSLKNDLSSSKSYQNNRKIEEKEIFCNNRLSQARKETKMLEQEVAEMERKAKNLGIFI